MQIRDKVRCCDLVMKGGVTSGVVYPGAIQQIAREFNLVGIGGTSAGAIAAAVAAAAEYQRRQTGSMAGFETLGEVSREMSDSQRLLDLFTPDASTSTHFKLAEPFLTGRSSTWEQIKLAAKLLWQMWYKRKRERFLQPVIANDFGVCSGMANDNRGGNSPLTEWLSGLIDRAAGASQQHHLTFRDLHNAKVPSGMKELLLYEKRSIDFRAVTTCLTFNRPFEFPVEDYALAFDLEEWRRLFPASVISQLEKASESIVHDKFRAAGKLPLPTLDLPIIVAARLSLSFPVLFSAVPVWAENHNKQGNPVERVLFSDGGITSNFPVHRFDAIYPRWPTLAINFKATDKHGRPLRKELLGKELPYTDQYVHMNDNREDGIVEMWSSLDPEHRPQKTFLSFIYSIFRSAQNWHDNAFLRLPGFRDRVAEVWLKPGQGGLNLNMDKAVVEELTTLGIQAGKVLTNRYTKLDADETMSWESHQWTRFRTGMEGLAESIKALRQSIGDDGVQGSDLGRHLSSTDAVCCFPFESDERRRDALRITNQIYDLALELEKTRAFNNGPRPQVDFGTRAPI
ncbi:MAG: patatin-like phospholipase family protein [Granulosicoccus sp.]